MFWHLMPVESNWPIATIMENFGDFESFKQRFNDAGQNNLVVAGFGWFAL